MNVKTGGCVSVLWLTLAKLFNVLVVRNLTLLKYSSLKKHKNNLIDSHQMYTLTTLVGITVIRSFLDVCCPNSTLGGQKFVLSPA